jgi:hypothetical protein
MVHSSFGTLKMRLLLAAALLLLPLSTVQAQTEGLTAEEQEILDGQDVLLYCATAFGMATQIPDLPAEKQEQFDQQSLEMFDLAIQSLTDGGVDEDGINGIADAYVEEVSQAITAGEEMRFSEEQCQAGYDAMNEG